MPYPHSEVSGIHQQVLVTLDFAEHLKHAILAVSTEDDRDDSEGAVLTSDALPDIGTCSIFNSPLTSLESTPCSSRPESPAPSTLNRVIRQPQPGTVTNVSTLVSTRPLSAPIPCTKGNAADVPGPVAQLSNAKRRARMGKKARKRQKKEAARAADRQHEDAFRYKVSASLSRRYQYTAVLCCNHLDVSGFKKSQSAYIGAPSRAAARVPTLGELQEEGFTLVEWNGRYALYKSSLAFLTSYTVSLSSSRTRMGGSSWSW